MKISTVSSPAIQLYGLEEGLQFLADAGFDAIDHSLSQFSINWEEGIFADHTSPEFAAYFRELGETIRSHGLEVYQTHAPYARPYISDMDFYANMRPWIQRAIYATGFMGCPYIVGHPVTHVDFCDGKNRDRARQTTLDYFGALVPALKEAGVTMCIENLYYGDLKTRSFLPNFCSGAQELRDIVDTLNALHGNYFAICVDTGHALIVQEDPGEMMKVLGDRVRVLHLHDTHGSKDDHLIPTRGILNWKEFAATLGQVDYRGTFNFEAIGHFTTLTRDTYSRETFAAACKFLYHMGRSLADIAEGTFDPN